MFYVYIDISYYTSLYSRTVYNIRRPRPPVEPRKSAAWICLAGLMSQETPVMIVMWSWLILVLDFHWFPRRLDIVCPPNRVIESGMEALLSAALPMAKASSPVTWQCSWLQLERLRHLHNPFQVLVVPLSKKCALTYYFILFWFILYISVYFLYFLRFNGCLWKFCYFPLFFGARRVSRFDPVGTTSGDVGTLLYRISEDPKQAGTGREFEKFEMVVSWCFWIGVPKCPML